MRYSEEEYLSSGMASFAAMRSGCASHRNIRLSGTGMLIRVEVMGAICVWQMCRMWLEMEGILEKACKKLVNAC